MKLSRLELRNDALVTTYDSRVLTSARYELVADMSARVVWIDRSFVPFELVARGTPEAALGVAIREEVDGMTKANRIADVKVASGNFLTEVCERCEKPFPSKQALGGHKRFCKGATEPVQ